jgi:hypothetical protein
MEILLACSNENVNYEPYFTRFENEKIFYTFCIANKGPNSYMRNFNRTLVPPLCLCASVVKIKTGT